MLVSLDKFADGAMQNENEDDVMRTVSKSWWFASQLYIFQSTALLLLLASLCI